MCTIIAKQRGVSVTPLLFEAIVGIGKNNRDGMGFAFKKDGATGIFVHKGFTNPVEVSKKVAELNLKKNDELIVHARIATSGEVSPQMTHPFMLTTNSHALDSLEIKSIVAPVMAHNGWFPEFIDGSSKFSDTYHFVKQFIGQEETLKEFEKDPFLFCRKYTKEIGYSKLAILLPKAEEEMFLHGDFQQNWGGLKFSNYNYDRKRANNILKDTCAQYCIVGDLDYKRNFTFTENPIKSAIEGMTNLLTANKEPEDDMSRRSKKNKRKNKVHKSNTAIVSKSKKEEILNIPFTMAFPENYFKEQEKKQKTWRDNRNSSTTNSNRSTMNTGKTTTPPGTQDKVATGPGAVTIGELENSSPSLTNRSSDAIDDALNNMQRMLNSCKAGMVTPFFRSSINTMNTKYLENWLLACASVYVDLTEDNCEHFMLYATRTRGGIIANHIYEIKSANRKENPYQLIEYKASASVSTPCKATDIFASGELIPYPKYGFIYKNLIDMVEAEDNPPKTLLKRLARGVYVSNKKSRASFRFQPLGKNVPLYSIKEYLNYNDSIYDVGFMGLDLTLKKL